MADDRGARESTCRRTRNAVPFRFMAQPLDMRSYGPGREC